jgi:hypothetical protein
MMQQTPSTRPQEQHQPHNDDRRQHPNNYSYYRASHPFTATGAGQLSLAVGDRLAVPQPHQLRDGWIWVQRVHDRHGSAADNGYHNNNQNQKGGWVPFSYLVPEPTGAASRGAAAVVADSPWAAFESSPAQRPVAATRTSHHHHHHHRKSHNPFDDDNDIHNSRNPFDGGNNIHNNYVHNNMLPNNAFIVDDDDAGGFGGAPMGGTAAPPAWTHEPSAPAGGDGRPRSGAAAGGFSGLVGGLGPSVKSVGSSVLQFGQQTGAAVGSVAKKTASTVQHAAVETKHRIDDMTGQRQQKQQPPPPPPGWQQQHQSTATSTNAVAPSNSGPHKRTQVEQMQLNAANGAARGALVGGAAGFILSGGNVAVASRFATTHAVWGGAHGAASGWKPFGK